MSKQILAYLELSSTHHNLLTAADKVSALSRKIAEGIHVPYDEYTQAIIQLDIMVQYAKAMASEREAYEVSK